MKVSPTAFLKVYKMLSGPNFVEKSEVDNPSSTNNPSSDGPERIRLSRNAPYSSSVRKKEIKKSSRYRRLLFPVL